MLRSSCLDLILCSLGVAGHATSISY